jgi:isopentenyl diphosphate isomerase/L-lactate dehydrogenase-like FMN-dependent dehydrogenase
MADHASKALGELSSIGDYERRARDALAAETLPTGMWQAIFEDPQYDGWQTNRNNRAAFDRIWLRPRVFVDVSELNLATTALEAPISLPVIISAFGHHQRFHPDGELATARGAANAGTIAVQPIAASFSIEEVAAVSDDPLWFQLYVLRDRSLTEGLVRRAEDAGYRALVVSADHGGGTLRNAGAPERDSEFVGMVDPERVLRNLRSENDPPRRAIPRGRLDFDPSVSWTDVAWLRGLTRLPLVVKGIQTAEDAALCCEHGIDAIVVSNHGGLALTNARATIDTLPEITAAVDGALEIYIDGGIRHGTDVLKCLALGARAVLIGRPALWGLAVAGEQGVAGVLEVLRRELARAMAFCGVSDVGDVGERLLARESP